MFPSVSFHFIWSLSSERTVSFSRPDPGERRRGRAVVAAIPATNPLCCLPQGHGSDCGTKGAFPPQASPQHPVAAPAVPCTSAGLEPPVQGGIPQVLIYTPAERQSSLPTGGGFL